MTECQIQMFCHCRQCMAEKPKGTSPSDWSRVEVGVTADGSVQVWCLRHDCEIVTFQSARMQ